MTDDQDATGITPVPGDKRPRPARPPSDSDAHTLSSQDDDESGLWSPLPPGRPRPAPPPGSEPGRPWRYVPRHRPGDLRRIPQLFGDTLALIGRRWRGFGEYALIGVAGYLVALVMLFLGLNALFGGQFFSKIDELTDPLGGSTVDFGAWLESFDVTPTPLAIILLVAFGLASVVGFTLQDIATSRLALDDVQGREVNANRTLMATLRRLPKIFVFSVAIGFGICLLGCGLGALLLWAAPVLGVLWLIAFVGAAIVIGPLLAVYFVMVYVEPRLPSPRRWWRLMRGRKAAIWGRVFLISAAVETVGFAVSMSLGALPIAALYGDLILHALLLPLVFMVIAVAHLLIYADLITGEQPTALETEPLG